MFKLAIQYIVYILTVFTATSFVSRRTATVESIKTIQTCSTVQTGVTGTLIYICTRQETACTVFQSQIKFISICGLSGSIPTGVLPEKLGGGVRPASQNPYPIYDLNLTSKLCFRPAF